MLIFKSIEILQMKDSNFWDNNIKKSSKHMSLTLQFAQHQLTCQSQNNRLIFTLEPRDLSNKSLSHYLYQAEYRNENLPQGLKFLFNQSTQDWFRYIQFYGERCFELNNVMIKRDEESDANGEVEYGELPFVFKFKVLEGLREPRFTFYGTKELYSREEKLEKLLVLKENVIEDYKRQLQVKDNELLELRRQMQELKIENEELRNDNSRMLQQQLPRKKIHANENHQEIPNHKEFQPQVITSHQLSSHQHEESNSHKTSAILNNSKLNTSLVDESSMQNQAPQSIIVEDEQNHSNDYDFAFIESIHKNTQIVNDIHSETFCNRPNGLQSQNQEQLESFSQENRNQGSVSMVLENRIPIEEKENVQMMGKNEVNILDDHNGIIQTHTINATPSFTKVDIKPTLPTQPTPPPQVISLSGQTFSQEKMKMIRQFASKKCFLQVGFDEKGVKKFGYCCMFCQKVFKEDQYLSKHFFTRHSEINNDTSFEYLINVLNNYKKRKQQKKQAIEANLAAERRAAQVGSAINRLTMK